MEFLKNIFGDKALTFEDFKAAVEADKAIKLANLADGKYVDKEKFDKKVTELKEANDTLEQLKGADIEKMKQTIADYEAKEQQRIETENAAKEITALKERFAPLKGENVFLNEGTESWIFERFKNALSLEENKGKSDADIFNSVTKDLNIYENPNTKLINPPIKDNGNPKADKSYMDTFYADNPFYKK